jgi:hypothetical protein
MPANRALTDGRVITPARAPAEKNLIRPLISLISIIST